MTTYLIDIDTKKKIELLDNTFLAEDQRLAIPIWDSTPDAKFLIAQIILLIESAGDEASGVKGSIKQLIYVKKEARE